VSKPTNLLEKLGSSEERVRGREREKERERAP
jgi:hypothetical protein